MKLPTFLWLLLYLLHSGLFLRLCLFFACDKETTLDVVRKFKGVVQNIVVPLNVIVLRWIQEKDLKDLKTCHLQSQLLMVLIQMTRHPKWLSGLIVKHINCLWCVTQDLYLAALSYSWACNKHNGTYWGSQGGKSAKSTSEQQCHNTAPSLCLTITTYIFFFFPFSYWLIPCIWRRDGGNSPDPNLTRWCITSSPCWQKRELVLQKHFTIELHFTIENEVRIYTLL